MRILEDTKKTKSKNKVESYSQSMLHNFFSHKVNKSKTSNKNDNSDNRDLNVDETLEATPVGNNNNNVEEGLVCNESILAILNVTNTNYL